MIKKEYSGLWARLALILSGCDRGISRKRKGNGTGFCTDLCGKPGGRINPTTQGADKFAELVKEKNRRQRLRYWSMQAEAWEMKNLSLNSCSLVVLILPEYPFLR